MTEKVKKFYTLVFSIIILLSIIFLLLLFPLNAATYYYMGGNISLTSSWKSNSNGTGTSPASFSGNNLFIVWNSTATVISPTLSATWNFGGTGATTLQIGTSTGNATLNIIGGTLNLQGNAILMIGATTGTNAKKLYIASNGFLNITSGATTPLRVYNNATLTIASSTFPASNNVQLNTGSWVEWAQNTGITNIWVTTYQNMVISGGGIKQHNGNGTLSVNGQLQMINGALLMSNNTGATLKLNGTISGTAPIQTSNSKLSITGSGNFGTIYFANGNTALSIRNLTINRTSAGQITLGSNLTVNGNFNFSNGNLNLNNNTLTLNGKITFPANISNGYFTGSRNSSINIGGTGTITNNLLMSTSTATTSSLYNLSLNRTNRTLTIGNTLRIWGELTATSGTIACGSNVSIKADATQKGRVGIIGTNADITGNITMEVFAKGGSTGWALLGIAGIQSQSFTAWADNFPITCPTCPLSNTFTSIYQYCEPCATNNYSASAHYSPIPSVSTAITPGQGYWVYLGTSTYTTNNIIIDATGTLIKKNFGSISMTRTGPANIQNGWNLIANPYPSPISFANLLNALGTNSTNIDKTIYVWNADLNGGNGDYAIYTIGVGSVPPVSSGGINDNIPTGQGFYLHIKNNTTLLPNENWKTSINSQNNLLRTKPKNALLSNTNDFPSTLFMLEMKGPNNYDVYTGIGMNPNATVNFDDTYDAIQVGSDPPAPQLMSVLNGMEYKLNIIPTVSGTFTMEIKAITGTTGNYTIQPIQLQNFSTGACVNLYDKFTGINHNLATGSYTFNLQDTTTIPRFILSITNNNIAANVSVLQQPTCNNNDPSGILKVSIADSSASYFMQIKDINGTILDTALISTTNYTFNNLPAGNYFIEISNAAGCSSSIYSVSLNAINNVLPVSSMNLLSNDTLFLDYTTPVLAVNQSSNATNVQWILLGDGFTSVADTFYYIPDTTGEYLLQLTAYNSCGDTSITQIPIVVTDNPNYIHSHSNIDINENVIISRDANGYYIQGIRVNTCDLNITDMLGRILKTHKQLNISEKYYINHLNISDQWIIINAYYNGKKTTKKIFYEE